MLGNVYCQLACIKWAKAVRCAPPRLEGNYSTVASLISLNGLIASEDISSNSSPNEMIDSTSHFDYKTLLPSTSTEITMRAAPMLTKTWE